MAVDTPATIAILGAGPMGIETGLYARYLGYDVVLIERSDVANNVRAWGHLRMFTPFGELSSSLGLAALRAQDPEYRLPDSDARLTGRQWVDQYLEPLAQTDLLAEHVRRDARVIGVSRRHFLKNEYSGDPRRSEDGFRILVEDLTGAQSVEIADIVVDTTGVYGQPNWCGAGGIPARGEKLVQQHIEYGVPDILGAARARYESCHTLVVGTGLAAATTIVSLAKLIKRVPETRVTWVTHRSATADADGPIRTANYERQLERHSLAEAANECASNADEGLNHRPGAAIEAIEFDAVSQQFLVRFDNHSDPERFDRIIANVGFRPDRSIYEELQVRECEVTEGTAVTARQGTDSSSGSADSDGAVDPLRLTTSEPNFYILGAKSYGRDSSFLMKQGIRQIRDLFSMIGGRTDLDLYATAQKLSP